MYSNKKKEKCQQKKGGYGEKTLFLGKKKQENDKNAIYNWGKSVSCESVYFYNGFILDRKMLYGLVHI